MTHYYIRRLYQQRIAENLPPSQRNSDQAGPQLDCHQLLEESCDTAETMAQQIKALEILVQFHQTLSPRESSHTTQLKQLEEKIFTILGQSITPSPPPAPERPAYLKANRHFRGTVSPPANRPTVAVSPPEGQAPQHSQATNAQKSNLDSPSSIYADVQKLENDSPVSTCTDFLELEQEIQRLLSPELS